MKILQELFPDFNFEDNEDLFNDASQNAETFTSNWIKFFDCL